MTDEERDLLRHACGVDSRSPYYRDYFAAEPGSDDDCAWAAMVDAGLASVRRQPGSLTQLRIYGVTTAGKAAIGKPDPLIAPPGGWEMFK